jgi:hypothetical protein
VSRWRLPAQCDGAHGVATGIGELRFVHGCQHLLAADEQDSRPDKEQIESALRREQEVGWIAAEGLREDLCERREQQPD